MYLPITICDFSTFVLCQTGEMPNGTGGKPGFLTDTFLRNHRDGRFPYEDDCHYLGLRKVPLDHWNEKSQPELACKQHRQEFFGT